MIKVGIVGGTGYTGVELLRLLAAHPEVLGGPAEPSVPVGLCGGRSPAAGDSPAGARECWAEAAGVIQG